MAKMKYIYSEKATKFCKISTVDLTVTTSDKFKVKISQNFVALSECMNFNAIARNIPNFLGNCDNLIEVKNSLNSIQEMI